MSDANHTERTEENMAKKQPFNDEYLSRVLSGKVVSIDNEPKSRNETQIIYVDHSHSRR